MQRGLTGRYDVPTVGGEPGRAFLPRPLPPEPPFQLDGSLPALQKQALLALGRLDALSTLLPDTHLFLYSYVRKEAVLSSQIEGTQSSLANLLLFELEQAPSVLLDDVVGIPDGATGGDGAVLSLAALEGWGSCRVVPSVRPNGGGGDWSCGRDGRASRDDP